jgi:RNA polymerase sigma-70 factor (ECF subfamily)
MQPSPEESDDDALMLAFAAGDARAFERLFRRHGAPLLTYLAHLTGERGTAEDLLQEIFLRVVRRAREYRADGRFRAWLHTIAHHALTDQRRRAALRPATRDAMDFDDDGELEPELATPAVGDDPLLRVHARELGARIEAALARLPAAQREVFLLRERAGLELAEIARATDANLATVKSRLRYALAGLRRILCAELAANPELSHE